MTDTKKMERQGGRPEIGTGRTAGKAGSLAPEPPEARFSASARIPASPPPNHSTGV